MAVSMNILGVDLAWGEKKGDGICLLEVTDTSATARILDYTHGDRELESSVALYLHEGPGLILVDAPLVCPNPTGSRPVDKLISSMFWRQHAGCHPANSTKCQRPVRIAKKLTARGFALGWDLQKSDRLLVEVYPHPAIVRLFNLDRIVKYKKGKVADKRREFKRLQKLIRECLHTRFPLLVVDREIDLLLKSDWSKQVEDRTDAFLCALIGYNHMLHGGAESELVGCLETGFILLPK